MYSREHQRTGVLQDIGRGRDGRIYGDVLGLDVFVDGFEAFAAEARLLDAPNGATGLENTLWSRPIMPVSGPLGDPKRALDVASFC